MDIKAINSAIVTGSFTNDELSSIIDAVKFARSRLTSLAKCTMRAGDRVKWNSPKQGVVVEGVITKVAVKFATVRTDKGMWKVPMNMLEEA